MERLNAPGPDGRAHAVSQLGGGEHVRGFLDYDATVHDRLVDAMVESPADDGCFERRPLLPQVGVRNR